MKMKTAVLTGVAGLMLTAGLGDAFAQPVYVYREAPARRYVAGSRWQAQQIVRQAYLDVLRREPDAGGLRQYTNAMLREGWSASDVRRSLMTSDEYAERFGRTRWNRGQRYHRGLRYQRYR